MSIDLRSEGLLSLTDAAKAVPPIDGKRPHVSTIWRWCRKGIRGVQLEYVRMGHRVCTSEQALARFAQRLAEADGEPTSNPQERKPQTRSERERSRSIEQAEADLAKAGI